MLCHGLFSRPINGLSPCANEISINRKVGIISRPFSRDSFPSGLHEFCKGSLAELFARMQNVTAPYT
jgi:hypothetical protein